LIVLVDKNPRVVAKGEQRGRDEVCKGLADAGTRLHHKVIALRQCIRNGPKHLDLLRALFESAEMPGEGAPIFQNRGNLINIQGTRSLR
jgi:hypothetical protein